MRKKFLKLLLVIVIVIGMAFSGFPFSMTGVVDASSNTNKDIEYLESVIDMIKEIYKGDISDNLLVEGALNGIFNVLDPYTTFFTPQQAQEFLSDVDGTFEGVGISIEKKEDYIVVVQVISMSPAEKSGMLSGDKIVSVDGKSIVGVSVEEAAAVIRGPSGTKVTLGVLRSGESGVLSIEMERAKIILNPVTSKITGDIGYIKLDSFSSGAGEFMRQALDEMDKEKIEKIILDLRNNPGGEVSQAVSVARMFVPKGLITTLDFKSTSVPNQKYHSYLDKTKYKLTVLVNGMSASASEIVAGAIQDTGAGTLIGTKTFGKAKVQNLIPLLSNEAYAKYEKELGVKVVDAYELISKYDVTPPNEEIIGWTKITTGVYTTPKGRMIDGEGLMPDIEVDDPTPVNGVDIYGIRKLEKARKPSLGSEGTDVYNAEKILKLAGYEVDTPDTKLDIKTYKAIRQFQKDKELLSYGVMDFDTQDALNQLLDELYMIVDIQYAKAVEILSK